MEPSHLRGRCRGSLARASIALLALPLVIGPSAAASSYTIVAGGAPVVVATTAAGETASVTFAGTAGQRVSLKLSAVSMSQSDVSIQKPDSTNLVTPTLTSTAGGFIDVKTLPTSGTYTILVDPRSTFTGSMTLTLYDVPPDTSGTITPDGAPVTVTTTVPGQNAQLTFAGTAAQRISLKISSTITQAMVSITSPDDSVLLTPTAMRTAGGFVDTKTLPATGTYTILVNPQTSYSGSMTLTLYDVPPDTSGTITPGGAPVTVTTTVPGQNARLTFAGTAGQRISLKMASTMTQSKVSITNPDSSALLAPFTTSTAGGFVDTRTLPATGTYTIAIDPQLAYTGSMTLTLYTVPADVSGTITAGGAPVTVTAGTPGQNARLTFTGTTGQRISVRLSNVTIGSVNVPGSKVSVLKPDGTALITPTGVTTAGNFLDTRTLPVSGTYSIVIDPSSANTGSMTLTLYTVPADISTTIVRGGSSVTLTMGTPGQNGTATFSGTTAASITLSVSDAIGGTKVSILQPNGTVLKAPTSAATISATLPVTGTYTIVVNPQAWFTGSVTLTLT